ncbi:MAG: hypothetical protein V4659_04040 [Pseudomonadota bacterium]
MKKLFLTTALAVMATASLAAPGDVKVLRGCEVVDKGGYLNKVDATCAFTGTLPGSRVYAEGDSALNPDDGDPTTARTVTVQDN